MPQAYIVNNELFTEHTFDQELSVRVPLEKQENDIFTEKQKLKKIIGRKEGEYCNPKSKEN